MSKAMLLHPYYVRNYTNLEAEVSVAVEHLGSENVSSDLTDVKAGQIVIPRYRVIPFGKELEIETEKRGATLINSHRQHLNIANQGTWWRDLYEADLTPIRFTLEDYASIPEGDYFVKGETNSLKNNWFKACYAPDKNSLMDVVRNNMLDSTIGSQTVYIQPFQKYRKIAEAVDGRPVFNERRVFIYKGEVLSHAPYWTGFPEALTVKAIDSASFDNALQRSISITEHLANFYVIDLAEKENGDWFVVELNDGSMSGLSANTPESVFGELYRKIQR